MLPAPVRWSLGRHAARVEVRLERWEEEDAVARLWAKDHTLWSPEPVPEIQDRLGWLTLPEAMRSQVTILEAFAADIAASGVTHVVLLGMGGSSLAPEVFTRTFGSRPGFPDLLVLDSTHPQAVRAVDEQTDPAATLVVVSSKSGTTIEPNAFLAHYWERGASLPDRGGRFVAITDPGTSLAALGRERGFRLVLEAPPDVGGRFSALTYFGLVPAALLGAPIAALLARAAAAAADCRRAPADNPGFVLGAILGELALAGRGKATFFTSPALASLPAWIEQLVAESTGKAGTGILPVAGEPAGPPEAYGDDRLFVYLSVDDDADQAQAAAVDALEAAGHPVIRLGLTGLADLGAEMYRWEVATAMAGNVLGIHPFDQPDVQLAKTLATRAMAGESVGGPITAVGATDPGALAAALGGLLAQVRPGDYVAIQAFVAPTPQAEAALQGLRLAVRDRLRVATTVGFGPRFLHSTGQLHKGGPDTGLFLQVIDDADPDLPVPETAYSFGRLVRAQADGDHGALAAKGRRLLRVDLDGDPVGGLAALEEAAWA